MTGVNESMEHAMAVGCPECGALPQEPCIGEGHWYLQNPHIERVQAADQAATVAATERGEQVYGATDTQVDEAVTERLF